MSGHGADSAASLRPAAIIVAHGSGGCPDLLAVLRRRYRGVTRLAIFAADFDAHTDELEDFMADVGTGGFGLIHVLPGGPADDLASPGQDEITQHHDLSAVQRVADVDAMFRRRFPALADVDTWVALDVGRAWNPAARQLVDGVAKIAGQARVRRVFAVSGSTDLTVAPRTDDRVGMLTDLAWNLAVSDLGSAPGIGQAWVWAVGSQSFTFDGVAWTLLGTSTTVAEAIKERPLAPISQSQLTPSVDEGIKWVVTCGIGTEEERQRLASTGSGPAMERITVDRPKLQSVAPGDWALAVEREHVRLCGAPLAAYTRVVEGNARSTLAGRAGDPSSGLIDRFDVKLTAELRDYSGCLKAGSLVQGTAEALQQAAQQVADIPHPDPKSIDLEQARADLDRAVAGLPEVRTWLVRGGLLSAGALAVAASLGTIAAVALPPAAAIVAGAWAVNKRRRAIRLRDRYVELVERKVRAVAQGRLITAELGMIKDLQSHVGSYFDDGGSASSMEDSAGPPINTRAADVKRIWEGMKRLAMEFGEHEQALEAWQPTPECGKFFHSYPTNQSDARAAFDRSSEEISSLRREVKDAVDEVLKALELTWSNQEIHDRIVAAADAVAQPGIVLRQLVDLDKHAAQESVKALAARNAPHLDLQLVPQVAKYVIGPASGLPSEYRPLTTPDSPHEPVVVLASADERRVSTLWLRPQDFPRPADLADDDDDAGDGFGFDGAGEGPQGGSTVDPTPIVGLSEGGVI